MKDKSKDNSNSDRKKFPIFLIVILVVIFLVTGALGFAYMSLTGSSTVKGTLLKVDGNVQVKEGKTMKTATENMKISEKSTIMTNSGSATVVLMESVFIDLKPNTEISVLEISKDKIKISQSKGSTWNKFTGLLGINGYDVETPNAVATVRGTEFGINSDSNSSSVMVGEGTVVFSDGNSSKEVKELEKVEKLGSGNIEKKELTMEEKKEMITNIRLTLGNLMSLRASEVMKQKTIAKKLLESRGISKSQIKESMEWLDSGNYNKEEIVSQIPVKIESIEKIFEITEKIVKQKKTYEFLISKYPELKSEIEQNTDSLIAKGNNYDFLFE